MSWARHVAHMREGINVYQVSVGKLKEKRPVRILRCR
jgi:hypothetical protein